MIYISHLLPDEQMREVIEQTGVGVESIDFSIADNLDCLDRSIENYRKKIQDLGIKKLTLHGPFLDLNPMTFDKRLQNIVMERYIECYEAAEALGAEKIVFHTGFDPDLYYLIGWAERMAEFYDRFLEGRYAIQIEMENLLDPEWKELHKVVDMVDRKNFSICFDMGHAHHWSPIPVTEWAEGLADVIGHVHVHDNDGSYDQHLALGKGNIPYQQVIRTIDKDHPTYTIECSDKDAVLETIRILEEECNIKAND